jgi:hypothetical protein
MDKSELEEKLEQKLQSVIFPELEKGRPNWDKSHTEAVVFWIKKIISNSPELKLDSQVLIIAAHAHDWGYTDLFKDGKSVDYQNVIDAKTTHMETGAEKLRNLLFDKFFDFLTDSQKERAIHLVKVHDQLKNLKDIDELVLMEADTLGGLDTSFVKPAFDKESNIKYMSGVKKFRFPLFFTEFGKKEYAVLVKMREDYYSKL